MTVFVLGLILAVACQLWRRPKTATGLFALSMCWLFLWGTDAAPGRMGYFLEKAYPPLPMDKVPPADVIVILGGAMGPPKGVCVYPELFSGADRVWHAARLYHAGKAPVIMPSGCAEEGSSVVFLKALGVPASAIVVENKARNTIENGLFTKAVMQKRGYTNALLVTSAFHMRRAEMIFNMLGVQVVPVATDHEAMYGSQGSRTALSWATLTRWIPNASTLERSSWYLKEIFGYWGDRWRLKKIGRHSRRL